jgi:predicted CoA-binding protein
MPDASLQDIKEFLGVKRLAVVGVSRDEKHFSRAVFREFVAKDYDAVPVNPQATEIEGRRCFPRISDVTPAVEAALLMTPPAATDQALSECNQVDIRKIWLYKVQPGLEAHEHAVEFTRRRGATVIEGYCPFMFLPHPQLFHRLHRFCMKVVGNYPHQLAGCPVED